jgi:hypothetical protein
LRFHVRTPLEEGVAPPVADTKEVPTGKLIRS